MFRTVYYMQSFTLLTTSGLNVYKHCDTWQHKKYTDLC